MCRSCYKYFCSLPPKKNLAVDVDWCRCGLIHSPAWAAPTPLLFHKMHILVRGNFTLSSLSAFILCFDNFFIMAFLSGKKKKKRCKNNRKSGGEG